MNRQALTYGLVMAGAVFFVGLITGMGGSILPNLLFSLLMGGLAIVCYLVATRFSGRGKGTDQ